jgi:hypothetical protein
MTLGTIACVAALVLASLALAQPGRRGDRGGPQDERGARRFDPERMRQMMADRMKQQLGASDAEWQVIQPRLVKVMTLNRQVSGGPGRAGMFLGRGRPGMRGPGDRGPASPEGEEPTAVEKASEQLRTALENESASPEQLKQQLTALREAREKAKQELATAQQELRQILTLRQEAQLVLMGMLD